MDAEDCQVISERDQLWASLRSLVPEIDALAHGAFNSSQRERQLVQLLARIVREELAYRAYEPQ